MSLRARMKLIAKFGLKTRAKSKTSLGIIKSEVTKLIPKIMDILNADCYKEL